MSRKRNRKQVSKDRVIPVEAEDIHLLLNKWERMTVRESSFMQTWGWANEAANMLALFLNRNLVNKEEN